jgi:hypothetical protein
MALLRSVRREGGEAEMGSKTKSVLVLMALASSGCAGFQFHDSPRPDAFTYFEPQPFLSVVLNRECQYTTSVVSLPGRRRSLSFRSGLGSADLGVTVGESGIITVLNSKTSGAVDDAVSLAGAITPLFGLEANNAGGGCPQGAVLYPILYSDAQGRVIIDTEHPFDVSIRLAAPR